MMANVTTVPLMWMVYFLLSILLDIYNMSILVDKCHITTSAGLTIVS